MIPTLALLQREAAMLAAAWTLAPRPRHGGVGVGALTLGHLVAQTEREHTEDRHRLPERTPTHLPGPTAPPREQPPAPPELMQRILDGLRRL